MARNAAWVPAAARALRQIVASVTSWRPAAGQPADFGGDLTDGADVSQVVQRHGDVEVIFELADELEDLQRVEAQIGQQLALGRGRSAVGSNASESRWCRVRTDRQGARRRLRHPARFHRARGLKSGPGLKM